MSKNANLLYLGILIEYKRYIYDPKYINDMVIAPRDSSVGPAFFTPTSQHADQKKKALLPASRRRARFFPSFHNICSVQP
jgi:hypothetical protein